MVTFCAYLLGVACALGTVPALAEPAGAAPDARPRVTITLQGADLQEALFYVFQGTGLRFEAPGDARETFTATLTDMPLEKALRVLLEPRGYTFQREGDLYRIQRREGYEPPGERLRRETEERVRREEAERSQRPRRVETPRVRFVHAPGLVSVTARPAGGGMPAIPLYGGAGRVPLAEVSARRSPSATQSFSLGPFTVSLPLGLRLLPGGGWEWSAPTEGETRISDGLGTRVIPFVGSGGLTVRRRR